MAEPTGDDVEAATAAVTRYCGWPVVRTTSVVTLDGPGGPLLVLPTLHLVEITAITENEVAVDLNYIKWSTDGRVRKTRDYPLDSSWFGPYWGSGCWWTGEFQGIEVSMAHGYTECPDFDKAVMMVAESMAASELRDDPALLGKRVDDVEYNWSVTLLQQSGVTPAVESLLAPYRLEKQP